MLNPVMQTESHTGLSKVIQLGFVESISPQGHRLFTLENLQNNAAVVLLSRRGMIFHLKHRAARLMAASLNFMSHTHTRLPRTKSILMRV